MQGSDFSKVRIGDNIWTVEDGDVVVNWVGDNTFRVRSEGVRSDIYFKCNGFNINSQPTGGPSAFWSKPNIEIPPPPKRMVKKKFEHWDLADKMGNLFGRRFSTKQQAEKFAAENNYDTFVYPASVSYETEVEE